MERKDEKSLHKFCKKCGSPKFKNWDELNGDEQFLVERIASGKFSAEERTHNIFCARCFADYPDAAEKRT